MFEGFKTKRTTLNGMGINLKTAGSGSPLLLHGDPQTHLT